MTYKVIFNLYKIEAEWRTIQSRSVSVTPFQNFDYMIRTWKYMYPYYIVKKYVPVFFVFYENDEPVVIFPFVKYICSGDLELFGNVNGFNYCDALYVKPSFLVQALSLLKNKIRNVYFYRVQENSGLYTVLSNNVKNDAITNNVQIIFGNNYEQYNKSLSKSTRQNLRTSYNRLVTDRKEYKLNVYKGGDNFDYSSLIKLYSKRHEERYGVKRSGIKDWFLLHQNFATLNYLKLDSALTFVLYIDGKLAAFMSGLLGNRKEFVVPRLSVCEDFLFYSPGIVLINEVIKYFIENGLAINLDMSQGEESYKYKMGGTLHKTHSFQIDLISL